MFVRHLLAICDGDDASKESIAFAFDFQRAPKRLSSTAPAGKCGSWYGSLYSNGVLIVVCSCREPRCEQEPSRCVPEGASLRRRARLVSTHPSADRPAPGEKDFYRLSAIFSSLTRKLVCKGDLSG